MSDLEELVSLLKEKAEINMVLLVAESDINLQPGRKNRIYVCEVEYVAGAAGGRAAGFGQRRFKNVRGFDLKDGMCTKFLDMGDNLDDLDSGFVVRLPLTLPDGKELMASCSIDSNLVREYSKRFNK